MKHDIHFLNALILILSGIAGGFINTFAAGGSIAQIPAFLASGLSPMIANTTNHVPVLVGFAAAVCKFHREGTLPWGPGFRISIPILLGAVFGALTASVINDRMTGYVLLAALLLALAFMVAKPDRWIRGGESEIPFAIGPKLFLLSMLVGFWAGLIVIGSGIFLLLILVLVANIPVAQANAIKVLSLGIATLVAVTLFAIRGQIIWSAAIPVAIGSAIGSLIAARLVMLPGAGKWVYALIMVTLVTEILRIGSGMLH